MFSLRKEIKRSKTEDEDAGPLRDVSIKYKSTIFRNLEGSPFAGPPSAEVDSAWDSLLAPVNIRVSQEELERAAQNSVALPESGGYLAWLQSFHEIHCIVSTQITHPVLFAG